MRSKRSMRVLQATSGARVRTRVLCAAALSGLPLLNFTTLHAQEREPVLERIIDRAGQRVVNLLDRPFHPFVTSVAPGGGIGGGMRYQPHLAKPFGVSFAAAATMRGFQSADAGAHFEKGHFRVAGAARARRLASLDFYGLGQGAREQRSAYALRDRAIGAHATHRTTSWLTLSAGYSMLWPHIGRAAAGDVPSVTERFSDAEAPGAHLTSQPRMTRSDAGLRVDVPASHALAVNQGGELRVAWSRFSDRESARFSFGRVDVQVRQQLGIGGAFRRLTMHGLVSTTLTRAGQEIPFYLLPTLGGSGLTLGLPGEPLGADGVRATLRGYSTYRFRDRHLMLLQAEYRHPIWGPLDVLLFADAGEVAGRRSQLDLSELHSDVGVGVALMSSPNNSVRAYLAFGGEGVRLLLSFGQLVIP